MKILRAVEVVFFTAALLATFGSPVRADGHDKLTIFTFSQPVELPGVALPAGTYVFKLADTSGDRNIVQVFDKSQTHLLATFVGIPDYRPQPSEKSVVRFSETTAGGPPAIKEWFYPGDAYGVEFVYPKSRAAELAKASNQPVPSMPSNLASDIKSSKTPTDSSAMAMKGASIKAEQPNGDEVEVDTVFIIHAPAVQMSGNTVHNVDSE
jgi:hypothetical protein